MERKFKRFRESGLFMVIIMLLCSLVGICDAGAMTADVINPADGGAVRVGEMQSVTTAHEDAEDLILKQIDEHITIIRPNETTLYTIARNISDVRTTRQQIVKHYAIDVIDLTATLQTAYAGGDAQAALATSNNDIFAVNQTIIVTGVNGYKSDQTTVDPDRPLVLFVVNKDATGKPLVVPVNGMLTGATKNTIPPIPLGTALIRSGRAASESQIRTDPYSGVPTEWNQYLQKFIAEVNVTRIFEEARKEVPWGFNDVEEEAIFDMKRTQNVTYWKGVKGMLKISNKYSPRVEETYFTEGIWTQAGKEFDFAGVPVDVDGIVELMKHAFTGNASGKKKLFICGSDVIAAFEKVDYTTRVVREGTKSTVFGLEFTSIISKFGTLLVAHDPSFDEQGVDMSGCAFILDADFLRKWTFGLRVQNFDLQKAGDSDADARALIEISGLVLKNPMAHSRVYLQK